MSYGSDIYEEIDRVMSKIRSDNETELERRKQEVYYKNKKIQEIDLEMSKTGITVVRAIISGENTDELIEGLKIRNNQLEEKKKQLLLSMGYKQDYLEPIYNCHNCKDKGYVFGKRCECVKFIISSIIFENLNQDSSLTLNQFSNCSLKIYDNLTHDEKQKMIENFNLCEKYARNFSYNSQSLYFCGGIGVGKTYLASCICFEVLRNGYNVIYDSVNNILNKIEQDNYERNNSTLSMIHLCKNCDLLLLDDFGSELITNFSKVTIYNIINDRVNKSKPTIITTNDDIKSIEYKYNSKIVSKIISNFDIVRFVGKDIGIMKKFKKEKPLN